MTTIPILTTLSETQDYIAGSFLSMLLNVIGSYIYFSYSSYLLLRKANYKRKWAAWVPYYQQWAVNKIAGKPGWWALVSTVGLLLVILLSRDWFSLLILISALYLISLLLTLLVNIGLAKSFGKSMAYALGLTFLPFPMYLILGLSSDKYINPGGIIDNNI